MAVAVPEWKRAVLKVGSALVAAGGSKTSQKYLLAIASFITACRDQGKEIILVSSGAVAAGLTTQPEKPKRRQYSIPEKQALAAIGQPILMDKWRKMFDFPCAQLLLTYDGIYERKRFVNAQNTLHELLKMKTLPIINENDTVATEELNVGDNDNLAAYVASLAKADLLIICSDIDGLYNADPNENPDAELIVSVEQIDDKIFSLAGGTKSSIATGGMLTKLQAAQKATSAGINTIIMNGTRHAYFELFLNGHLCGTIFKKSDKPITAKKHWMLHALPSCGQLYIDNGAVNAIGKKGASLLSSGIVKISGEFRPGDAVEVFSTDDEPVSIAKGIIQYHYKDLKKILGKKIDEIPNILPDSFHGEVIHRDDLVIK